jgi:hypothetical protein
VDWMELVVLVVVAVWAGHRWLLLPYDLKPDIKIVLQL